MNLFLSTGFTLSHTKIKVSILVGMTNKNLRGNNIKFLLLILWLIDYFQSVHNCFLNLFGQNIHNIIIHFDPVSKILSNSYFMFSYYQRGIQKARVHEHNQNMHYHKTPDPCFPKKYFSRLFNVFFSGKFYVLSKNVMGHNYS